MLEQHCLQAIVNSEYLQCGIGELPLIDLVTVSVAEDDYEKALEVLREYENEES